MSKSGGNQKIEPDELIRAYIKRKDLLIRPDMTVMPLSSPGWSLFADDLGNRLSIKTLYNKIRRQDIVEALYTDHVRTGKPILPVPANSVRKPLHKLTPDRSDRKGEIKNLRRIPKTEIDLPEENSVSESSEETTEKTHSIVDEKLEIPCKVVLSPFQLKRNVARGGPASIQEAKKLRKETPFINIDFTTRLLIDSYNTLAEENMRLREENREIKNRRIQENQEIRDLRAENERLKQKSEKPTSKRSGIR